MSQNEIKIMIISPWKKIIGKIRLLEESNIYEVKDGLLLEEAFTKEGMRIVPMPIIPSNEKSETFYIRKEMVIILPVDPPVDMLNIYLQLMSNILVPDSKILI